LFNHPQYKSDSIGNNNGSFGVNFNGPTRVVGNANSASFLDSAGNPVYPWTASGAGSTGCNAATHLADPNGQGPETACAASIVNTTIGNNFGNITQSRENGWRQIQYGLKFSF